ncbi:hypothetical protein KC19_4G036600 [Ceratodon purpureus]|uniref:Myb-like domain-containing protein n=1 Tax=Ceratodon purpureus TaxID=3225 RepID=A0A8T0I6J9_CERPU|nr:hypothetical protein KC19_4G036600 [Ceratodon purpureus]
MAAPAPSVPADTVPTESNTSGGQQRRRAPVNAGKRVRTGEDDTGARSKKDRDPNWTKSEILSLIEAKRQEHLDELTVDDPRELMCPELGKWGKIAVLLNATKGDGDVHRDRDSCKYKWNTLMADFKKIWDFHSRTGRNSEEYFRETTPAEKKLHNLPKTFYFVAYKNMAEWLRDKATLAPPHARDTMNPNDSNYHAPIPEDSGPAWNSSDIEGEAMWPRSGGGIGSPIHVNSTDSPAVSSARSMRGVTSPGMHGDFSSPPIHTASTADVGRAGTSQRLPRRLGEDFNLNVAPGVGGSPVEGGRPPGPAVRPHAANTAPAASPLAGTVPPVSRQGRRPDEIHILSSTATSAAMELRRTIGSTGHRKRKTADSSALAEGVTESAEKMVQVLSEINDTHKSTEKEKLELQTRHFAQQLEYKRERDRVTFENFRISQEHTRLSLLNQGMVVQALAGLANAITRSVSPMGPPSTSTETKHAAPTEEATGDAAYDEPAAE